MRAADGSLSATLLGPAGVVAPVEQYLAFLDALGRSWHTVRGYASDLALYFDFLAGRGVEWQDAGMADMGAFSAYLRGTNRTSTPANVVVLPGGEPVRAPASTRRALTAVCGFYDFHSDTPLAKTLASSRQQRTRAHQGASRRRRNPLGVAVPSILTPSLTEAQLGTVLATPARHRDRLLLATMGLNGLRVGAALGLRHEDLRLRQRQLWVVPRDNVNAARAKRSHPLIVPLHPTVARLYVQYLEEEYGDCDSDYVFINLWGGQMGRPLGYDAVRGMIARTAAASGIPFTAHVLRHTFATLLRRNGAELEAVSELLGHASVETTRQTYVHTSVEDLRRSLDRLEAQPRTGA